MPKKYFRKYLPSHASLCEHRHFHRIAPVLKHPNLWHLNRRSVAGGVAVGAFAGMIPGPVQMLLAAFLSVLFRVNLPVAVALTWYTNPVTVVPLYWLAYKLGVGVLGHDGQGMPAFEFQWGNSPWSDLLPALWHWFASLGPAFVLGVVLLGAAFSVIGYFAVMLGWRAYVVAYWYRRRRRPARLGTSA